ncbi:MAG TPA: hypothetical protein VFA26_00260 [Gemmataceae bacterium]|nr:hypothetical protein [Gemmataceae bacterium]
MPSRILLGWLAVSALPLLDGLLPPAPGEWVRRGNAAYERRAYSEAAELYDKASRRTTDPGQAAFNRAAALYAQNHFREAELLYRACLEDAVGRRRACALYGLGNALTQQGPERGAGVLAEAVRCYERCLRHADTDADLAADARHNLELAKLMLAQAPPRSDNQGESRRDAEASPKPPPEQPMGQEPDLQPGAGKPEGNSKRPLKAQQGKDAMETDDPAAGGTPGSLPPVPDQGELAQMSREDAEKHLAQAVERINRERRKYVEQQRPKYPGIGALDW